MTTPILALQEIAEGVASQGSLHNQALREFEARTVRVLSMTTTAPPGSPSESDSYIIPTGSPMSWLGAANQIAVYLGAAWSYYTPVEGVTVWVNDLNALYTYNGAAWDATVAATSPLTTKGDVYSYSSVNARLGVGANATVLTADSGEATGLKWAAPELSPIKWGGAATYASNLYTLDPSPVPTGYATNDTYLVYIATQNSSNGPSLELLPSNLGQRPISDPDGTATLAGDVRVGYQLFTYDGTNWRMHRPSCAVGIRGDETIGGIKTFTSPIGGVSAVASADLVTKAQLDAKVYAGRINNFGAGSPSPAVAYGPSGWTVSRGSTGVTTVTHNLGTTNYAVVPVSHTSGVDASLTNVGTNNFDVTTFTSSTGAAVDSHYSFTMVRN